MRVLFVQWTGEYREAYQRLAAGGKENYRSQRYCVDAVGSVASHFGGEVTQLAYITEGQHDEVMANGVRSIGLGFASPAVDMRQVVERVAACRPTHLVQRCLSREVIRWAANAGVRVLCTFAESREVGGLRHWWRNRVIARLLNRPEVEWVGNHQVPASRWLSEVGVRPEKVVPYDFLAEYTPESYAVKELGRSSADWTLAFVGTICDGKGVPDIVEAVARLTRDGFPVRAKLAGSGQIEEYRKDAAARGVADRVEFLGRIPNVAALGLMHDADLVLVPSRYDYTEAFPFTIVEAFTSRTPLVASDHPMFRDKVRHGVTGLVCPAGDAAALAGRIREALTNAGLYKTLSENSLGAWRGMQIPVHWSELVTRWLEDTPASREWMRSHALGSGRYD